MFNNIICFLTGRRIIEINNSFVAQVYELSAGWCGIDGQYRTWAKEDNIKERCRFETLQEANDHLQNYFDQKAELKVSQKKKIHNIQPVPQFWRILRNK
jgi:hypothetical protein